MAEWTVEVVDASHNHDAAVTMSAYSSARKLSDVKCQTIKEMSDSGASPKVILATLRQQDENCPLILKDIYNEKARLRNDNLQGRTPLESLLDELCVQNIFHAVQQDVDGRVTHLFFAPPTAIRLAREFPHVILMDSTYKTNRYVLPY